ncbi:Protein of unknown function [Pyronema omphalodes CBS 100304]|uniref:Uncharacterized protein n=1 Tax=Pyronema omphalodes (strain CBS 100304) TaxID=1076935 RepID=U4LIT7_PYROM|nr:Protein of unknown function [Pyronema omphalodes CBS 100304]
MRDPTVVDGRVAWPKMKEVLDNVYRYILPRAPNLESNRLQKKKEEALLLLTVCASYGGVHLAA